MRRAWVGLALLAGCATEPCPRGGWLDVWSTAGGDPASTRRVWWCDTVAVRRRCVRSVVPLTNAAGVRIGTVAVVECPNVAGPLRDTVNAP